MPDTLVASGPTATPVSPCTGAQGATSYRTSAAAPLPGHKSYRILKQRVQALRGHAEQVGQYVGMELDDPAVDFIGLARSLGIAAERARTVHEATDLVKQGLAGNSALLIDVELDREI